MYAPHNLDALETEGRIGSIPSKKFRLRSFQYQIASFSYNDHLCLFPLWLLPISYICTYLVFNMIIIGSFGRSIRLQCGNKVIWMLYLLGAFAGGLSMHYGMPFGPMVVPKVGADASIAAMITFSGLLNLHSTVMFFFFPMKIWVTCWLW